MSEQVWHAFYFDRAAHTPCRSEVIAAQTEEDAARVAREHLGGCERVSLEAASWTERRNRVILAERPDEPFSTMH